MKMTLDCMQIKREAQRRIRDEVRGMTREQEIAYFREGADEFRQRQEEARAAATRSPQEKRS